MTLPTTYAAAILLTCLAMVCWGSWVNTTKLAGKWRFELFYVDFSVGLLAMVSLLALTLGETGEGLSFRDNLLITGRRQLAFGFAAGAVFNLANMLLVAAMSVAGIAVAYPVAVGLGLAVGITWSCVLGTQSSVLFLATGAAVLLIGIFVLIRAYMLRVEVEDAAMARQWKSKHRRPPRAGLKAIWLSVASGVLMGSCFPLVDLARETDLGLRPYSVAFLFGVGIICSTPFLDLLFMNVPVQGKPLRVTAYLKGSLRQHLAGFSGGAIWAVGAVAFLAATGGSDGEGATDALGYAIVEAAVLAAALWGLFYWREFKDAPRQSQRLMVVMLAVFAVGLSLIAFAAQSA